MVTDRTQTDVDNAKVIISSIKAGVTPTEAQKATLERGTLTITVINRIESAEADLKDLFDGYGINAGEITTKAWTSEEIFDADAYGRILDNLRAFKNAFCVFPSTPAIPSPDYHYAVINNIEKILEDLYTLIDGMAAMFVYSGEIYAGEW